MTTTATTLALTRRLRRLRRSPGIRGLVRETRLSVDQLIYPLFVCEGHGIRREVGSMPGVFQLSVDETVRECEAAHAEGIPAVLLFGLPDTKDETGTSAFDAHGPVQQAIVALKAALPDLLVITDVCLCEYTSHGHCGVMEGERLLNDPTLDLLARTALSHARAGADVVGASADELRDTRQAMLKMLKENGPSPEGRFADLKYLEPVRDYKARHASTMLTFDAVVDAIDQIERKAAGQAA